MLDVYAILGFGFLLGLKHSIEADHVVAVATLSSKSKGFFRSAMVGVIWGLGHTTSILLVGLLVMLIGVNIPEKMSIILEMLVGFMLIWLGLRSFGRATEIHSHEHEHEEEAHEHIHTHFNDDSHNKKKSFMVGLVHGLAGSGALMILILSTIKSLVWGLVYIVLFGVGSIMSMGVVSGLICVSMESGIGRIKNFEKVIRIVSGGVSVVLGLYMVSSLGIEYMGI